MDRWGRVYGCVCISLGGTGEDRWILEGCGGMHEMGLRLGWGFEV